MTSIWIILAAELRAIRNRFVKTRPARAVVLAIALLIGVPGFGGGVFTVGVLLGRFVPSLGDAVLTGGFTALSVLTLLIGFPTVIATFFVGRNLLLLVLAPVRPMELFLARLAAAMSANVFIGAVLALGVIGLGVGAGASVVYLPLALLLVAVQVVLVTSVQVILIAAIVNFVPARLARDVSAAIAGLTGASLYLIWNISLRGSFRRGSKIDLSSLTSITNRIDWLPPAWPGHALSSAIAGNAAGVLAWTALTVAAAATALVVAGLLYGQALPKGLGLFGTQSRWRKARRAKTEAGTAMARPASPVRGIARKDWLAMRRDVRRLTRVLPALIFPIGYAFAIGQSARTAGGFWANVFLVSFIAIFMAAGLALPSVPTERRGFLLLRMAPLRMRQVLAAKILLTLPPIAIMTSVFGVVVGLVSHTSAVDMLQVTVLVLWLSTGYVAISVAAGGVDPHFDAVDDRRGVGLFGSLLGLGASTGYAIASIGAFALFRFAPLAISGDLPAGPIPWTPLVGGVMIAAGVVLAVGAAALPVAMFLFSSSRLERFEGVVAEAG